MARFDSPLSRRGKAISALLGACLLTALAGGAWLGFSNPEPVAEPTSPAIPEPLARESLPTVALRTPAESTPSPEPASDQAPVEVVKVERQPTLPGQPLSFAEYQRVLQSALKSLENFPQYTATLTRQERKKGKLEPKEVMQLKLRQSPYAVYMGFVSPKGVKGQEAIYVKGKNNDKIVGHGVGLERLVGTVYLAANEDRPIHQTGLHYLVESLISQPERNPELKDCAVYRLNPEKVGDRVCDVILLVQPRPVGEFRLSQMRVWLDQERGILLRNERWNWQEDDPRRQELVRDVIYTDVNPDVELTDADFDHRNKAYKYP